MYKLCGTLQLEYKYFMTQNRTLLKQHDVKIEKQPEQIFGQHYILHTFFFFLQKHSLLIIKIKLVVDLCTELNYKGECA